jgi:hypothetical protein
MNLSVKYSCSTLSATLILICIGQEDPIEGWNFSTNKLLSFSYRNGSVTGECDCKNTWHLEDTTNYLIRKQIKKT